MKQHVLVVLLCWEALPLVSGCPPNTNPPPEKPLVAFTCGKDEQVGCNPCGRIVGGSEAVKNSVPWQAALITMWSPGLLMSPDQPICGGVIISPYHVLTSALCAVWPNMHVVVGEHNTRDTNDSATRHEVKNQYWNPQVLLT